MLIYECFSCVACLLTTFSFDILHVKYSIQFLFLYFQNESLKDKPQEKHIVQTEEGTSKSNDATAILEGVVASKSEKVEKAQEKGGENTTTPVHTKQHNDIPSQSEERY